MLSPDHVLAISDAFLIGGDGGDRLIPSELNNLYLNQGQEVSFMGITIISEMTVSSGCISR